MMNLHNPHCIQIPKTLILNEEATYNVSLAMRTPKATKTVSNRVRVSVSIVSMMIGRDLPKWLAVSRIIQIIMVLQVEKQLGGLTLSAVTETFVLNLGVNHGTV